MLKEHIRGMSPAKYIRWFEEIRNEDVASVGGKNASLGEMYQDLTKEGVRIPNGFAITADAYWHVLKNRRASSTNRSTLAGTRQDQHSTIYRSGGKKSGT
jgi:pyruvate,water dikinase